MGDQERRPCRVLLIRVRRISTDIRNGLDRVPHHGFSGPGTGKMGLPGAVGGGGAGFESRSALRPDSWSWRK